VADADLLRKIPQVDAVLRDPSVAAVVEAWGPALARRLVQDEIERERNAARRGAEPENAAGVAERVARRAAELESRRIRRVVNATGVVLHTNLGRAPLSDVAIDAAGNAASYAALEYDPASGERGERAPVAATLLAALTGADAALVVNNNAAAVLLALSALGRGREVVVSRGELIEIGGEFRLPEIMEASGAVLREVGTTNRTHGKDFRRAMNDRTALVLKVHPSNYRVVGFTSQPPLDEVIAIAHEADVPVLYDVGSGLLSPDERLADEPDAASALEAGCDLVCFSGDKLLGGPQAGVLAGRRELIEACRRNPIARAVRADKLTLAAMEATALAHARGRTDEIPVRRMIGTSIEELRTRAERIVRALPEGRAVIEPGESVTGGGSLPGHVIETVVLAVSDPRPDALAAALRSHDPPVIARVEGGRLMLDLRTVTEDDDPILVQALGRARTGGG
jgi:L-seryl-tRNA(Ser) seleniumtransferase